MPAPNPWTLYDFETQLEEAAKDVLTYFKGQAGLTFAIKITGDTAVVDTPRVELEAGITEAIPQWAAIGQGSQPKQVPVGRFFSLRARVVVTQGGSGASVGDLRGLVRWAFSAGAKGFNANNLPYLQILELWDVTGFDEVAYEEKEQAGTPVVFAGQFAIKDSAWPQTP